MCILELSKNLMYDFHCNYGKDKCGNKSQADSLVYGIETNDMYEDFYIRFKWISRKLEM